MEKGKLIRLLEFFLVGLVLGIVEDLLAIKFSTGAAITWKTVQVASLVALPFAIFSELIVDHPKFWHRVLRYKDDTHPKRAEE